MKTADFMNPNDVITSGFEKWDNVNTVGLSGACYEVYKALEKQFADRNGNVDESDWQEIVCGAFQVGYGRGVIDCEEG